jgi:HK97 family phage major capsid protein
MRAQSTTASEGGYTIPEGFQNNIWSAMGAYGGIRTAATVISTATGNPLPFITNDDTGNVGALLAENVADSEQDTVFGEIILNAWSYTSKIIRVSQQLLQDNAVNLESYLGGMFAERLGRATAAHYATGDGASKPNGLMTAAAAGITAGSATAVTYLELLDLKHSVDPAHRLNATWAFNDTTFKALKKLVDADGRPLWSPELTTDAPATLDGDRYVIDQGIASMTTGNKTIAYGDLSKYHIRDVLGITMARLVERYAEFHQVGFVAILRTDADLIDAGSNPVKVLTQA